MEAERRARRVTRAESDEGYMTTVAIGERAFRVLAKNLERPRES